MNIVNLTPHAITLRSADGTDTVIPPSGTVARVDPIAGIAQQWDGVPVPVYTPSSFGNVSGLPDSVPGNVYIVSLLVAGAVKGRPDVLRPGTGPDEGPIRNEKGHVIAVTRLIQA